MKKVILLTLVTILVSSHLFSQTSKIDSLEAQIEKARGQYRIDALENLIQAYSREQSEKSLFHAKEALEICRALKKSKKEIFFLYTIGDIYYDLNEYKNAMDYYQDAYHLSKKIEDPFEQSLITERIGIVYDEITNSDKALEYFLLTLKNREKSQNKESLALVLSNIGSVYYSMSKNEIAYDYFQRALELIKDTGNKADIGMISINIGNIFLDMKQTENALEQYQNALDIYTEINDHRGMLDVLNNLALLFTESKDYIKAEKYFDQADEILEIYKDNDRKAFIYSNMALLYLETGNIRKAGNLLRESRKIAEKYNLIDVRLNVYERLARYYSETGQSRKTYEYYHKYTTLVDSVFTKESDRAFSNLHVKYEMEKKEKEISQLSEAKKNQLKIRNYFILISILILLLLIVLIILFKNKDKTNKMLEESNKKFQDMFEKHSAVMLLVDPKNGDIVSYNLSAKNYYGFSSEKNNIYKISTHTAKSVSQTMIETLQNKQNRSPGQHRLSDGQIRDIELFSTPIKVGNKTLIYSIVQDNTDRLRYENELKELNQNLEKRINEGIKKAQQQQQLLIQKSKLESLGILAAGIAHEINQPLGGISMGLDNILFRHSKEKLTTEYLKSQFKFLFQEIERIKHIIQHVRSFSRDQESVIVEKINVNEVIYNTLSIIQTQYENHQIKLEIKLKKKINFILGNKYKLEQVVLNLLTNAKDAVEEKALKSDEADYQKMIMIKTDNVQNQVIVEILDNGIGIPENIISNIFDPFFTTKGSEKGTGLGLSIIYGIITEMNGSIDTESEKGKLTKFSIKFPVIKV